MGIASYAVQLAYAKLSSTDRVYLGPITSNTTISGRCDIAGVDSSGGAVTVTLSSSLISEGYPISLKDIGGAAGTNTITIETEGSETIDGSTSGSISTNYGAATLFSDGTNWYGIADVSSGGTL